MGKETHHRRRLLLLLLFYLLPPFLSAASPGDSAVMSALAGRLSGVSWKPGSDPCSNWDGVKCTSGRVTSIDLSSKAVSGTLPDTLGQLSALQILNLGGNLISGPLPSLSGLSSLQNLDLGQNAFTSIPGNFFSGLTGLQTVVLDDNPLDPWPIPLDLAQCASLQTFSAGNASVSGGIPDFFSKLPTVTEIRLSYNNLTGGFPSSFAGSSIQRLYLNNQKGPRLSGPMDVVGAMAQLQLLWIQSNGFTGPIPDLSNLTSLESFNVRDNQLTGPVPPSLISCPTLKNATLSNNLLQGPFPKFPGSVSTDVNKGNKFCSSDSMPCDPRVTTLLSIAGGFGYPSELANHWLGNDPCISGWTGVFCDPQGKNIVVLNLPNKHYGGTISPDIASLTSLTKVILSNNNLTGTIPVSLTKLPQLQLLDVTDNNLSGKIPDFPPSVSVNGSGNPMLGSDSGSVPSGGGGGSGSPSGGTPGSSSGGTASVGSSSSRGYVIGGVIVVVVVIGCAVGFVYYYYQRRKKHIHEFGRVQTTKSPLNRPEMVKVGMMGMNVHNGAATSGLHSQSSVDSGGNVHMIEAQSMLMSIQALRKATNNFSEDNILGRGGFGVVYKGELNGTLIAVKRNESDIMGKKGMEEFQAEIAVLRKVRHRHLVALLGYCVDGNERLLVYEYMSDGTLGQHLFDRNESRYSPLSWKQRLTIALDVARGIEYLHSLAQESFIHRDIKPSNILLDKDLRAKVSDFGLVKLADNEKSMMTRLAGTFGYLAPEYAITGKVSTKVDVYAFGVILMEIITGRKALDESLPDEETHLVSSFRRNILNRDRFTKHVDRTLNLDVEAWSSMFEVAELAQHCTAREPNQRPDMGHAVNVLSPLVEKWQPNRCADENNYDDSNASLSQRLEKWQFDDGTSTMGPFSSYKGSGGSTMHD